MDSDATPPGPDHFVRFAAEALSIPDPTRSCPESESDTHKKDEKNLIKEVLVMETVTEKEENEKDKEIEREAYVSTTPAYTSEEHKSWMDLAVIPSETPEWLPAGWVTEVKMRTSGAQAGTKKDRYYYDPTSRKRFRSKKEVFDFLETGTVQRSRPKPKAEEQYDTHTPSGKSRSHERDGSLSKRKRDISFDYVNRPEKVKWVLTDPAEGLWTPYVSEEKVSKPTRRAWSAALEYRSGGFN
ncbi:methyl-CpG-binding domain-containing protein 5-like [Tasmannia lanceolata]|uniref:methyl-CpG-binding domain-containing protein 5-like n=1 Tax=Tasmannia lanceolata TaxID=3420 RepID=UPI00406442A7